MKEQTNFSWEGISKWYDEAVGEKGHYYHEHLILPNLVRLLKFNDSERSLLDLGCGQGVVARHLPKEIFYLGVDISHSLIQSAKKRTKEKNHQYLCHDLGKPLDLQKKDFTDAVIILALQNMEFPLQVIKNGHDHLKKEGKLILIINHPCFRIPRQSSWEIDGSKKLQFRRVDRYFSPMKIPIKMHPGKEMSEETWSFHYPLSTYAQFLKQNHFVIEDIEEWCCNKTSYGKAAKWENFSRKEFPLFMAIVARKL